MSTASMTFGRSNRIVIPRGSIWFANLAFALINLVRRIDRWQLERAEHEPQTAAEVMELAHGMREYISKNVGSVSVRKLDAMPASNLPSFTSAIRFWASASRRATRS